MIKARDRICCFVSRGAHFEPYFSKMDGRVRVEEEFEKNSDLTKEDFQNLKDWYGLQPHFPQIPDELLIQFFHSCRYKMEPTKTAIDNYLTMRTHVPDFFSGRDSFAVNAVNGKPIVHYGFLNGRTPKQERVLFTGLWNTDPSCYVFLDASRTFIMHYDLELHRNGTAPGDIIVIDLKGVTLGHVARLHVLVAKKILYYIQEALPIRLNSLHMINVVPFIDKIMAILKPFMKKEFLDKLHFHTSGMENFYNFVPKNLLPQEYGGNDKSIFELTEKHAKLLQSYQSWFAEEEQQRVDESKRQGKPKNANELFGVEGSFKKLDFD